MALARAKVTLYSLTGREQDAVQNVWHFVSAGALGGADFSTINAGLQAFYNAIAPKLGGQLAAGPNDSRIQISEVTRGLPGETDDVESKVLNDIRWDRPNPVSNGLPSELALALSFRGDVTNVPEEAGTTRPASRRRGRVYLGPFGTDQIQWDGVTNRPRPIEALRTAIISAYNSALTQWALGGEVQHVVYSRANGLHHPVIEISVDDAFDIQRSRGEKATGRTRQSVTQATLVP